MSDLVSDLLDKLTAHDWLTPAWAPFCAVCNRWRARHLFAPNNPTCKGCVSTLERKRARARRLQRARRRKARNLR